MAFLKHSTSFKQYPYGSETTPGPRMIGFHWRFHWLLLLLSIGILMMVLGLTTNDARATRSERAFWMESAALARLTSEPGKTVLPLRLPPPTANLFSTNFQDATLSEKEWQTLVVNRGDNLSSLFLRLGLNKDELQNILDLGTPATKLTRLLPGHEIRVRINGNKELQELVYDVNENSLRIHREQEGLQATDIKHPLERRLAHGAGIIDGSLFGAGHESGLSDPLIMEMADIFRWDIDFAQNLRSGDSFAVLYEEYYLAGEKVRDGEILAAEFVNRDKTYRAIRFKQGDADARYYSPDGLGLRKDFLVTPVKFTRISSGFNLNRYHPVLHRIRAHKGVDYAAPHGTPITAAGNARIEFKGIKGGYGNTIILKHAGDYTTLYAHMSGFAKGLKQGDAVKQGQIIGYLGRSGLATGPHLHYEFRIKGVHADPLSVKLPRAETIADAHRQAFLQEAGKLTAQLDIVKTTRLAFNKP